ncbi:MAG: Fe-S cluster assembly protein SufD [Cyanobacteria bacterium]|nr:Fe-S cluster assembly protein SufD [Cyanobacteriota bacterium]
MVSTITRNETTSIAPRKGEPEWLTEARLARWQAYNQLPLPDKRQDEWRKTLIDSLKFVGKEPVLSGNNIANRDWLDELRSTLPSVLAIVADTDEGCFVDQLPAELAAKGVIFTTISEAVEKHADLVKEYLLNKRADSEEKLSLLSEALFGTGAFLYIPNDVEVKGAFLIANRLTNRGNSLFPRIVVAAGRNSRFDVINLFSSGLEVDVEAPKGGEWNAKLIDWHFSNAVVDLYLESGSRVNYLEVQDFSCEHFSLVRNYNSIERDAHLYSLTVGLHGGQLKSNIRTDLKGRGAGADVRGIVLGTFHNHLSYDTVQNHLMPDTTSKIDFRIALKENAVSAYQGNIKVEKEAQRIEAFQTNKNLLLSESARADSIPRLEILADDVKCSHGATVGPIDKEQIFYLMTRGLSKMEAEELVVSGFFNTVLETCEIEGARDWINRLISEQIQLIE